MEAQSSHTKDPKHVCPFVVGKMTTIGILFLVKRAASHDATYLDVIEFQNRLTADFPSFAQHTPMSVKHLHPKNVQQALMGTIHVYAFRGSE